ncbi:unnamed protein product [Closterium sp. Yama58-4]|nr:unnamed protein product [Closterium sp. Yama58-4]
MARCGVFLSDSCDHTCIAPCGHCIVAPTVATDQGQGLQQQQQQQPPQQQPERNHKKCMQSCKRPLPCAHLCPDPCHSGTPCKPCTRRCLVACQHSSCPQPCHRTCAPCAEPCGWRCKHQGRCSLPCGAPCDRLPCEQRCEKKLKCGHQCPSLCSEKCPPKAFCTVEGCGAQEKREMTVDLVTLETLWEIDPDESPVLVLPCGHAYTVETLDGHLGLNQVYQEAEGRCGGGSSAAGGGAGGGSQAAASKWVAVRPVDDGGLSALKGCPECRQPITGLRRYGRMVNKALLDESERKFALSCLANQQQLQTKLSQLSRAISACPEAAQPWQVWELARAAAFLTLQASKLQVTAMEPPTQKTYQASVAALQRKHLHLVPLSSRADAPTWEEECQLLYVPQPDPRPLCEALMLLGKAYQLLMAANFPQLRCLLKELQNLAFQNARPNAGRNAGQTDRNSTGRAAFLAGRVENCRAVVCMGLKYAERHVGEAVEWAGKCKAHRLEARGRLELVDVFCAFVEGMMAERLLSTSPAGLLVQIFWQDASKEKQLEYLEKATVQCHMVASHQLASVRENDSLGGSARRMLEKDLRDLEQSVRDEPRYFAVTEREEEDVFKAIGLGGGHWYRCRNGHVYAIGECGGAMEESSCPECGEVVGGTSHRLREASSPSTAMIKPRYLTHVSSNGSSKLSFPPSTSSRAPTSVFRYFCQRLGTGKRSISSTSVISSTSSISRQTFPAAAAGNVPGICRAFSKVGHEARGGIASQDDTSPPDPLSVCVTRAAIMTCPGHVADALMDALLSLGATTCSIEDANTGTEAEQEIYSSGPIPWDPSGPRNLCYQTRLRAFFPANQSEGNIRSTVHQAADSVQWAMAGWAEEGEQGEKEAGGGKDEEEREEVVGVVLLGIEEVVERDWVQQVQDSFHPIRVDQGLWIVPSWATLPDEVSQDQPSLAITLEPGLAFGTGDHPTTRLCLRWLRSVVTPGCTLLDYGTGSGVLAIAGIKMGAAAAVGVDIDELSVAAAAHNASLNSIPSSQFSVLLTHPDGPDPLNEFDSNGAGGIGATECRDGVGAGVVLPSLPAELAVSDSSEPRVLFDVVAANILVNPLLLLAGRISSRTKPGGKLGLSGILTNQVEQVVTAYAPYAKRRSIAMRSSSAFIPLRLGVPHRPQQQQRSHLLTQLHQLHYHLLLVAAVTCSVAYLSAYSSQSLQGPSGLSESSESDLPSTFESPHSSESSHSEKLGIFGTDPVLDRTVSDLVGPRQPADARQEGPSSLDTSSVVHLQQTASPRLLNSSLADIPSKPEIGPDSSASIPNQTPGQNLRDRQVRDDQQRAGGTCAAPIGVKLPPSPSSTPKPLTAAPEWVPLPNRYLMVSCTNGGSTNRLLCLQKTILAAILLNRTLLIPEVPLCIPRSLGRPVVYSETLDIGHLSRCFGDEPKQEEPGAEAGSPKHVRALRKVISGSEYLSSRGGGGSELVVDKFLCGQVQFSCTFIDGSCGDIPPEIKLSKKVILGEEGGNLYDLVPKIAAATADVPVLALGDLFFSFSKIGDPGPEYFWPSRFFNTPCELLFQPSQQVLDQAAGFIEEYFGGNYASLHLRRTDFLGHSHIMDVQYWPLQAVAECTASKMEQLNLTNLFVSSDASVEEMEVFKEHYPSVNVLSPHRVFKREFGAHIVS